MRGGGGFIRAVRKGLHTHSSRSLQQFKRVCGVPEGSGPNHGRRQPLSRFPPKCKNFASTFLHDTGFIAVGHRNCMPPKYVEFCVLNFTLLCLFV